MHVQFTNISDIEFEGLFKEHYRALHNYAYTMLKDEDIAEEVVQNMFLKLWEKREDLSIQTSVKAFLYRCVHNDSLNYIKHQTVKLKYEQYSNYTSVNEAEPASAKVELSELEARIKVALNQLPEQCRTVFQLSRFEELKYKEIANRLGISIKTVENQMGKALKSLRLQLSDLISVIPLLITALTIFCRILFK